ncbi:hypothetical protein [Lacrimispora sp.]|uniref:hypothetical protein n=1 Tax=Lacrimispora sp. TaxID=2719234 RepID=UPI003994687A
MAESPGQHLTAEEIDDLARQRYPEMGPASICRTVQVDRSVFDKVSSDDGFAPCALGASVVSQDIIIMQFTAGAETYFPSRRLVEYSGAGTF